VRRLSRRARRLLALTLSLAVAAAAAGLAVSLRGNGQAQAAAGPSPGRPAASPGPQPGSIQARADLAAMQSALNSGSLSVQAALLVPPFQFAPGSRPILPPGKTITIQPGTLRPDGGQFATARASLSDGTAVTVGLYAVGGHLHLYAVNTGPAQTRAKVTGQSARAWLMDDYNYVPTPKEIGRRQPVILIHGIFNDAQGTFGSDNDPASMFFAVDMLHGTWTSAYNYGSTDGERVDVNGPPFAQYVRAVARASKEAGGPGKVVVVAYSMGGLITRWAATAGGEANDIAMVITIAVPNEGAPLADKANTVHSIVCKTPQSVQRHVPYMSEFCADFTAAANLAAYGSEIKALKPLPASIELHSIAAELYVFNPLGWGMVLYPMGSDMIVPVSSALAKRPGGNQYIIPAFRSPTGLPDYSYWHGALPKNPVIIQKVRELVSDYLQAHPMPTTLGGADYWLANGGQWFVHDYRLQITQGPSGLTGTEHWNAGPCDWQSLSDTAAGQCWGSDELAFTSQPDGSLAGTVTSVPVYSSSAGSLPAGYQPEPGEPYQGQAIKLVPVAPMLAKFIQVSNDKFGNGNSNLCQQGLPSATETQYCGA
jgi:pimeloyl-ACP methyl ester carboxylesterase